MKRSIAFAVLLALSLQGCTSAGSSATPTIDIVKTAASLSPAYTATPPAEPSLTQTATPPTPSRPLDPDGPWLVSLVDDRVFVMNTDGSGVAPVDAPPLWLPYEDMLTSGFDSTGFLAVRTFGGERPPADLALTIFELPSLQPIRSIPLLTTERRAEVQAWPADRSWWDDVDLLALDLDGFRPTLLWSPDGRYLAFVGLMDGPSADVYAYDTRTDTFSRLTDGPGQPILMGWSPDGRWVIHMEAIDLFMGHGLNYTPLSVWAADIEGGAAKKLYETKHHTGNPEHIVGWRSTSVMVASEVDVFGITRDLKSVDLNTGEFRTLFDERIFAAAVDPESGAIAFLPEAVIFPRGSSLSSVLSPAFTFSALQGEVEGGIYLVPSGEVSPIRLEFPRWEYVYGGVWWIGEIGLFTAAGREATFFTPTGEFGATLPEEDPPLASPNGSWLLFGVDRWGNPGGNLRLYTAEGVFVGDLTDRPTWHPQWSRDSIRVYYLMQPDGTWEWKSSSVPAGEATLLRVREGSTAVMMLAGPHR